MAAPVDWSTLVGYKPLELSKNINDTGLNSGLEEDFLVTIEASCPSGAEFALTNEIKEKFPSAVTVKHQGRVFFDVYITQIHSVLQLRCVDNAYVIIGKRNGFDFSSDIDTGLSRINDLLDQTKCENDNDFLAWNKGIIAWNELFGFKPTGKEYWHECVSLLKHPSKVLNSPETTENNFVKKIKINAEEEENKIDQSLPESIPKFRATCYRSGQNCHPFGSMDVARSFGGAINDKFGWGVSMKDFNIEVVITVDVNQIYIGIGLTHQSLFVRNIEHFGPTTLRATICASLLQLADIKTGDVVVDPMCGGGSIPIEGAIAFKKGFHVGGDNHEKAVLRANDNFKSLSETLSKASSCNYSKHLSGDILRWDVTKLPLRDNSIDVFVTDLPFGKRSGSKTDNRVLYPKIMSSMARVVKPCTGRAVVLTQDKTSMFKAQEKVSKLWKINRQHKYNIGGLSALVFVMTRTEIIP